MGLMSARARGNGVPVEPPYFPDAFVKSVTSRCPMSKGYDKKEESNPFYGKKIFVASGAAVGVGLKLAISCILTLADRIRLCPGIVVKTLSRSWK